MNYSEYTADSLNAIYRAEIKRIKSQNPKSRIYPEGFKLRVTNEACLLWVYYRTSADGGNAQHGIAQRL